MRKYNIAMIIVAAILLELTSSIQYYMARRGVEKDMVQKASVDMEQNQRVTRVKAEVESAVHNYAATMRNAIETPDNYYSLSARMVIDNPHIVGAGIAFRPGYYARLGKDELYAPYAYDEHPDITAQNLKKKKKKAAGMYAPAAFRLHEPRLVPAHAEQRLLLLDRPLRG